jgi:hypothetical protein
VAHSTPGPAGYPDVNPIPADARAALAAECTEFAISRAAVEAPSGPALTYAGLVDALDRVRAAREPQGPPGGLPRYLMVTDLARVGVGDLVDMYEWVDGAYRRMRGEPYRVVEG